MKGCTMREAIPIANTQPPLGGGKGRVHVPSKLGAGG